MNGSFGTQDLRGLLLRGLGRLAAAGRTPLRWSAFAALPVLVACDDSSSDPRRAEERSRAPLAQRLAQADVAQGKRLFRQCAACHTIAAGGGDRNGPNLHGVVGRPVATGSRRFGYTAALEAAGGTWTPERLDAWLQNPQRFAPGTSMIYAGMPNGVDRADVIAFLRQQGPPAGGATPPVE
ncbi:c-type cytochrome [Sphingomonas desiccabilis]|uniref:C-type cytochrome n=1 Tax=Sphingomonas desiccabilis TaxID=429134 RepID=A0A4Q2IZI2_9SPHN|nr:c-type cytochrome [Sphingomonas desiccabilis]MBB3909943.1 cytochrome c [Sphingomonas desiccabilis]RXZ34611.1 c-type cytochrome [Sphingomonas desiccabilis]